MIKVKTVRTKKELKAFIRFANELYRDVPNYVPDLVMDEMNSLRPSKNPAFAFTDSCYFLAYRNETIVGRIGVLVNHKSNEKWHEKNARFTHFDFIDDLAVSKALMTAATAWATEKGTNKLHGPLGITDLDRQGLLVEGFDELDMFITIYNHPYYMDHMEKLGFEKEIDWIENQLEIPNAPNPALSKIAQRAMDNYGYRLIEFSRKKDILKWSHKVFHLYNDAYAPLYGTTDLTEAQIDMYVNTFFSYVNSDFIKVVTDAKGELAGFVIALPSLSKAMQKGQGRLVPFGAIHLLKSIRHSDILDLYLIAVRPDLQGAGVNAILMDSLLKSAIRYNMKVAETGPTLETNRQVLSQWKFFNARQHRRRRIYMKTIDEKQVPQ